MEQRPWKTNRFSASQEISPFYGKQIFNATFTGASHLSLSWAHYSGSIQVWCTRLYFVTRYVFTLRTFSHPSQPLSWSTTPCRLCATAFSIYSQLPSILEVVPLSATGGLPCCGDRHLNYLGYIAYCDGFSVTSDSEDVLSVCVINSTFFFLLDMFHSYDPQERSHITPRNFVNNCVF